MFLGQKYNGPEAKLKGAIVCGMDKKEIFLLKENTVYSIVMVKTTTPAKTEKKKSKKTVKKKHKEKQKFQKHDDIIKKGVIFYNNVGHKCVVSKRENNLVYYTDIIIGEKGNFIYNGKNFKYDKIRKIIILNSEK